MKPTANSNDTYQFKNGILTIVDAELDLHIQEDFTPHLIPSLPKPGQQLAQAHYVSMLYDQDKLLACVIEKQGVFDGQYRLYYSSGKVKLESYYVNGNLHGPSVFFAEQGSELAKSWFYQGRQVGKHLEYYLDGNLYSIQRFIKGERHGVQEYFYSDGTLKTLLHYDHGILVNKAALFHPDGSVKREVSIQ